MKGFLILVGLSGCFYIDPINQRPSLAIVNTTGDVIGRGQIGVTLRAEVSDPEGQIVQLDWRMYVCDDASVFETCDQQPAREDSSTDFVFAAPSFRAAGGPAQSLLIELDGVDDLGAKAQPSQQLIIPLGNGAPTLITSNASAYGQTINTPLDIFAIYGDPDDNPDNVTLTFELFSPTASTATLSDTCTPQPGCLMPADATKREQGKRFTPDVPGQWEVRVTATDLLDGSASVIETVIVVFDQLPCIGQVTPAAPPPDSQLPVGDPTLFQVYQVLDAIDPYPTNLADPILGQSEFHWSIKRNTGARQALPTETGNTLAFDPESFSPGDVVELRVEIEDRGSPFPLTCDPVEPTCQLDPTLVPTCLQRQTWKVVVQ